MGLSSNEIILQSKTAYNQWCKQWRDHCKQHKEMGIETDFMDFSNTGVGKVLLLCGNGYSLEEEFETIKKYRDNIDIMVCDKSLGHFIERGIRPDYAVVCDANVDYEKYCMPWEDKLDQTTLFVNVCANPEWTKANWKQKCLFVNMDSINSEREFGPLSGCHNLLPAATNVSNQMAVLVTQSSNKGRNNWFGYDKIVLIGFDYCWHPDGNYYAFDHDADGKRNYMSHAHCLDRGFNPCFSSSNLIFSAKWLDDYIKGFQLPFVSGTKRTLLASTPTKNLQQQLQYKYKPNDSITVQGLSDLKMQLLEQVQKIDQKLTRMGHDHMMSYRQSI